MRTALLALVLLIAPPTSALASCEGITQQQPLNACLAREVANDESGMNSLLNALFKIISPGGQHALRETQSAWVLYRDKTCKLESMSVEGGSMHGMVYGMCIKEMIKDRVKRLKYYLTCTDDDASCVRGL